ncbi:hypothetical protein COO91_07442 [Nostoc flagelliforme CCNUN1]|uniref:Uncharacterized protein n=1 Tax=Nostoc flagelliforme CCNUN1 TaxID=2038116 RepID=A0A2K8T115_9NOSO|nr:hypothetical protein COO91_07442 [Nostoc flagelliforme CCNUN1]
MELSTTNTTKYSKGDFSQDVVLLSFSSQVFKFNMQQIIPG